MKRRHFIKTATGTALLGITACDSRKALGVDVRSPSVPRGFSCEAYPDAVELAWLQHNLTDVLGNSTESGITYRVYRDNALLAADISGTSFADLAVEKGARYLYALSAADASGNESERIEAETEVPLEIPTARIVRSVNGAAVTDKGIQPSIVSDMLRNAVLAFTGLTDTGKAFESFFPGLASNTVIGIKVNTLAGSNLSTHPEVVQAVVSGLAQMLNGTFPVYNIIVFDDRDESRMSSAKFIPRDQPDAYRILTTRGLWGPSYTISGVTERLSALVEQMDYMVNVPVLKYHSEAGVTFALKNMFGVIDLPGLLHGNKCTPAVGEVYSLVKDKTTLIVGDALYGSQWRGPDTPATFVANTLLVGTDPVAVDRHALGIINARRGDAPVSDLSSGDARHIYAASCYPYRLGAYPRKYVTVVTV